MVTTYHLTVELRFSNTPPEEIFEYFTMYQSYRQRPIYYCENLIVRLERLSRERIETVISDICASYDDIHRASLLTYNDTGMSTAIDLYWYRDGTLEIEERLYRSLESEPVTDWHLPPPPTEKIDPRYGDVLDHEREPVRYLKLDYGFYTLPDGEAVYNHEAYDTCPEPPRDELLAFELPYGDAAHSILREFSSLRKYPHDARLVDNMLLLRIRSGASDDRIETHLERVFRERYVSNAAFRYRIHPTTRHLSASHYTYSDGLEVVERTESTERGVVDHRYRAYSYKRDPATVFGDDEQTGIPFNDCSSHPLLGHFETVTARPIDG